MFTLYSSHDDEFCVSISSKKHGIREKLSTTDLKEILTILEVVKDDVSEDLYAAEHQELWLSYGFYNEHTTLE